MNHRWRVESQLSHVNGDEFRIRQLYRKERLVSNKKFHGKFKLYEFVKISPEI